MDDSDDFMTVATKDSAGGCSNAAPSSPGPSAHIRSVFDEDDQPSVSKSSLVQYLISGSGFFPARRTTKDLPPGVYKPEWDNNGQLFFESQNIPLDNLIQLPDSKSEEVIKEIAHFWSLKEVFKKYGFLHKRGMLLYGPPGSGKSATIMFVTKQLVNAGGIVFIANDIRPDGLASALSVFREVEPNRPAMVVLEDIDSLIQKHGEAEILSLLDGESSIDNVCYVGTTNYPENLDGRVINRPSRFDRVIKIGMPTASARKAYMLSRGLGLSDDELAHWVEETEGFSIAHIKEVIIGVKCFGNDFDSDIKRIKSMSKTPKSDDSKQGVGFGRGD